MFQSRAQYWFVTALVLLLSVLGGTGRLSGQSTYGSLTGQVTDPVGAAIVGAGVTLTNVDTNYPQTAKTDGSGVYLFKLVSPGSYSLSVSNSGFSEYIQKGIVINANANATQNVSLKVGNTGATVTVESNTELIDTTSAELGATVNEYSVTQLPLNGRNPSTLVLLSPGMQDATARGGEGIENGFSFPTESGASANGGRQGSTYYMLDGVSNMDNFTALSAPMPNPDATQEFRLISNNFSAVYGFSAGGVVSIATKSGSNQFHGGLFEFLRNQDLNAKSWFGHELDPMKKNVFGGDVGGPILKDKLFIFGNYQGTRQVGSGAAVNTHTPTANMMAGDFSGLPFLLNGPFVTINGKTNQLASGASLNPIMVQMTKDGLPGQYQTTSTSVASLTSQDPTGQMYYQAAALKDNFDEYTVRADYDLSKSQRLTLRSFVDRLVQPSGDTPGNTLSVLNLNTWTQGFKEQMYYYNEVLQHTWTVNPNTVNTVSVLWSEQTAHNGAQVLDHNSKPMCWSRYINVNDLPNECYMEGFSASGGGGGFSGAYTEPSQEVRRSYGFSDTLIKTVGRHTLSAGTDLTRQWAEEISAYPAAPIVGFNGTYTGSAMADFLLGYMGSFEQGGGEIADIQGWQVNPYFNDDFRLRAGLTITAGIRWDPDLAPVSVGGRGAAYVAGQQSTKFINAPLGLIFPGDTGMNGALRPSNYGYWEPRLGIAYQPKSLPHTAFHAGFGLFSGPVAYSDYNHVADVAPFSPTYNPAPPSSGAICSSGGVQQSCVANSGQSVSGYMNLANPWQTSTFGTGGVSPFPPFASTSYKPPASSSFPSQVNLGASFARDFKGGMTQSWNFSIEQQLSANMAASIAYVGSESYHQGYIGDDNPGIYSANQGGPNVHGSARALTGFTQILQENSGGTASYNSLQIRFDRHMAHGLQAQSAFTWQKTIDLANNANISFTNALADPLPGKQNQRWNRGTSSFSVPYTSVSNFVYESPSLKGQNLLKRETLGGWELSGIITLESGAPFSIGAGNSTYWNTIDPSLNENNTGSGSFESGDRGNAVSGQHWNVRQGGRSHWINQYFNTAAFVPRKDGEFGETGRNIIYGPPAFNVDAGLMKNWNILEKYQIQFRFEFFNAFNHAVMGNPDTGPSDGNFGKITSTANAARVGQAALKLSF
jgi:hypothetical protein